jgi:hypothetical protein
MQKDDFIIYTERETIPHKTPQEYQIEWLMFTDNLKLIIDNSEILLNEKRFFYIESEISLVGTTITGGLMIPLGCLLLLWKESNMKETCPDCNQDAYVINTVGSALSGSNHWRGYCFHCDKTVSGSSESFWKIWVPAYNLSREYINRRIIKRYNLTSINWYDKLNEKRRPDEVIKEKLNQPLWMNLSTF